MLVWQVIDYKISYAITNGSKNGLVSFPTIKFT